MHHSHTDGELSGGEAQGSRQPSGPSYLPGVGAVNSTSSETEDVPEDEQARIEEGFGGLSQINEAESSRAPLRSSSIDNQQQEQQQRRRRFSESRASPNNANWFRQHHHNTLSGAERTRTAEALRDTMASNEDTLNSTGSDFDSEQDSLTIGERSSRPEFRMNSQMTVPSFSAGAQTLANSMRGDAHHQHAHRYRTSGATETSSNVLPSATAGFEGGECSTNETFHSNGRDHQNGRHEHLDHPEHLPDHHESYETRLRRTISRLRECELLSEAVTQANVQRHLKEALSESLHNLERFKKYVHRHSRMHILRRTYAHRPDFAHLRRQYVLGRVGGAPAKEKEDEAELDVMEQRHRMKQKLIHAGALTSIIMILFIVCIVLVKPSLPEEEQLAHVVSVSRKENASVGISSSGVKLIETHVVAQHKPPAPPPAEHVQSSIVGKTSKAAMLPSDRKLYMQKHMQKPEGSLLHHSRRILSSIKHQGMSATESASSFKLFIDLQQRVTEANDTLAWETIATSQAIELRSDQSIERTVNFQDPGLDSSKEARLLVHATSDYTEEDMVARVEPHTFGNLGKHKEWISALVLVGTLSMIAFELIDRVLAAMLGASIMLGFLTLLDLAPTLEETIAFIDVGALSLLFGMMILVAKLGNTGFFEVLTLKLINVSHGSKRGVMLLLSSATALMSMFLDNVSTILLVAPLTLTMASTVGTDPKPLLMAEVLLSNIGGAATQVGDPPNIIIGNALSNVLSFNDFLNALLPPVVASSIAASGYLLYIYRDRLQGSFDLDRIKGISQQAYIHDQVLLLQVSVVLFFVILAFLLQEVTGVGPDWVALFGAIALLLVATPRNVEPALEAVEWSTLVFFAGLFVMVEAIREAGLIAEIAGVIETIIGTVEQKDQQMLALTLICWVSALVSTFVDNVPWSAVMVTVIEQLANKPTLALDVKALAWSLSLGSCFGGNGSLIGASANIVCVGIADKRGSHISFLGFTAVGMPVMVISLLISNAYLLARYP